jgi:hypothetical protein
MLPVLLQTETGTDVATVGVPEGDMPPHVVTFAGHTYFRDFYLDGNSQAPVYNEVKSVEGVEIAAQTKQNP